tara:strand:+ start:285 stop:1079 length:795 start_codon:yes stop_codon:yes gene_type:complete
MNLGIKNKKALITGGATGIGQAIAVDLAKEGVSVAITSRSEKSIEKTLKLLKEYGSSHYGIVSNITDSDGPEKIGKEIKNKFGDIDIVVNNAGHTLDVTDPHCGIDDWRKVFRLNLEITIEINNIFLPHMKSQDWGRIVNITSGAGLENSGPVTFSASKAALTAYSRSMGRVLAIETGNVVMTAVSPGVVITEEGHWQQVLKERPEHADKYIEERSPLGRFGEIYEISPMVVLLCSEKASFCQGAIVPVDAGQSKHYMYFNYLD